MTIASAFNEIAVAQGGTASKSGTITGALDALTDALAGSDQPAPQTIEQGVRMLGEHIGGGGGGGDDARVFVYLNGHTGTFSINGSPVTLTDSADVSNAKEFTAPAGSVVNVDSDTETLDTAVYATLQDIIDDGDYITALKVMDGFHAVVITNFSTITL